MNTQAVRESKCAPFGNSVIGTSSPACFRAFLAHPSCFGPLQYSRIQKFLMPSFWNLAKIGHVARYSQPSASAISSTSSRGIARIGSHNKRGELGYMTIVSRMSTYLPFGRRVVGTGSPAFFRAFLAQLSCFGLLQHVRIQNSLAFSDRSCEKTALEHSSKYSQSCAIIATSSRISRRARSQQGIGGLRQGI